VRILIDNNVGGLLNPLPYRPRLDRQGLDDRPSEEPYKNRNTECSLFHLFSHLHWLRSSRPWAHLRRLFQLELCVMGFHFTSGISRP
jgi:hypothetical protein